MMNIKPFGYASAVLAAAFLFSSCGNSHKTTTRPLVKHEVMDTITVLASNNPLDIYRATEPRYWDVLHTRAALSFNYAGRTADGKAWIRLSPYNKPMDSLVLDAKSMTIDKVSLVSGNSEANLPFKYIDHAKLVVHMPRQYRREDTAEVYISYTAQPYATLTGGSAAILDDRGLYFINADGKVPGKPRQIWTQGETQANSHWLPTVDQPNERFIMRLELTVPDSFISLSNGSLDVSMKAGNGLRKDVWVMNKPVQTYAYMFAIGNFAKVEDSSWKNREISYYVEPEYARYAKKMFNHTPEMVDFFSKFTGVPYPWNKYSQVVVRDYVSGAMENTTASLFGEFMNQNFREIADNNYEDVVSHELFHQWFGDYVTAESWSNLTVNESFANYGEQLWRNYKYGAGSADELAMEDIAKYYGQAEYNDEPLVRFHYTTREEMFDRISYQKGGAILRYIHGLAGDEAFSRAMQVYLTKNALQPAEAHNWRMALEEATGTDWTQFFNQWYYRGGHPVLDLKYDYDDAKQELTVRVQQTGPDSLYTYKLPLKAALVYGNDVQVIDWNIAKRKDKFTYPYRGGVKPVFVPDHQYWLPGVLKEKKTPAEWLTQYRVSDKYMNKRRAVSGAFMAQNIPASQEIFHAALKDSLDGIRHYTLTLLNRMPDKYDWRQNFRDEVRMIALTDGVNRVRAAAFDVLGNWNVDIAKDEMLNALNDSSYMVAGAALSALNRLSKDTGYLLAKRMLNADNKAHLESAIWSILALKGEPSDISVFEQKLNNVYGTRKLSMAQYLQLYIITTTSLTAYEQGLNMLTELAAAEGITSYRYNIGAKVVGMPAYYQEQLKNTKDEEKKRLYEQKKTIAERYRDRVVKEETDPENIKAYKRLNN